MLNTNTIRRLAQAFFWPAVVFTIAGAVIPPSRLGSFVPWDKAGHFIAFYALTLLAIAAFPRRGYFVIGAALSMFGALIEVVQATPLVHRDADWHDWLADTLAILAVIAPIFIARWRGTRAG